MPIVKEYGKSDLYEHQWGLFPLRGQKIAAIITYCGSIEYYAERAIWKLENLEPIGIRPHTDAKTITHLLSKLERLANPSVKRDDLNILKLWCSATRAGFTIRNNIAHGVVLKINETLVYARNSRWYGETRKREFGDFWADDYTLDLVCDSFAVLLRIIVEIQKGQSTLAELSTLSTLQALREASSILSEFSSQNYND